jgi:LysM repeat protein/RNA polymerase subunit RPABC4/transcription elongation factor Spt4
MSHTCHRCGLPIPQGCNVCPNCGATIRRLDAVIRCRHCRRRAPSHLTLCPHCGRRLQPWQPDRLLILATAVVLGLMWVSWGGQSLPLPSPQRIRERVVAVLPRPVTVEEVLADEESALLAGAPTATPEDFVIPTPIVVIPLEPELSAEPEAGSVMTATAVVTATAALTPTVALTNTIEPVATTATGVPITPTLTPTPTATMTATSTAVASPTATPAPVANPTATPTPTAAGDTYTVAPGDTLVLIAERIGRSVAALMAYNGITNSNVLRAGQVLRIPPVDYTPPPPPTPTPTRPRRTATPTPPPATLTPALTVPAPVLVSPGSGSGFRGNEAPIYLQWQNPGGLPEGAGNRLVIGVLVGPDTVDWRFQENVGAVTDFRVPVWLFGQAPQEFGRTYVWYVEVVSGDTPISPPSPRWQFQWQ